MQFQQSRIYQAVEAIINFLLLNLLWIVMCLPIVTIYPATAALFGVTRSWSKEEDPGIIRPFFRQFRQNLVLSLLVGAVWTLLGGLLLLNAFLASRITNGVALPLLVLIGIAAVYYALASPYIFPVIVNFQITPLGVLRNATLLVIRQPLLSVFAAVTLISVAVITYFVPPTLFFSGVAVASGLNWLASRAMRGFLPETMVQDEFGTE